MQNKAKKITAALAAVQMYLEQEEAALIQEQPAVSAQRPVEPGPWAQFGRADMMTGRRMIQLRAFSGVR
jgi:hypothetical protein